MPLRPVSHRDRLSHFQPPATVRDLQFLDTEGSTASGRGRRALGLEGHCFWPHLVEMFSTCFPVFTELRAGNAACGRGNWPGGVCADGTSRWRRWPEEEVCSGQGSVPAEAHVTGWGRSVVGGVRGCLLTWDSWGGGKGSVGSGCLIPEPPCGHQAHPELHEHWFSSSRFCFRPVRAAAALAEGSLPGRGGLAEAGILLPLYFLVQMLLPGHLGTGQEWSEASPELCKRKHWEATVHGPLRGDVPGTETSADTQGRVGSPQQVHPPLLGTHSGQTPFHSGHGCTRSDKEISPPELINLAGVLGGSGTLTWG